MNKTHIASLDFDGTLRVNDMEKDCIDLLTSLPSNIINVINTGRGIGILQEKVRFYFPEHFDNFINAIKYFICNNGTDIYYKNNDDFDTLKEWSDYLSDQWDRELLLKLLAPVAQELDFELYPEYYNFKLLYYFLRPSFNEADEAIAQFRQAIAMQPVNLVYAESSQKAPEGLKRFVCEIFPNKAGKGNALIFLKEYLEKHNQPVASIACFGDDRNDLQTVVDMPLLYDWWYGCLVGNSTNWILDKANAVKCDLKGKIVIAPKEYPGPLGIKWIMHNLGWIE